MGISRLPRRRRLRIIGSSALTIDELGSFLARPPSVTPSTSREPFRPLEKRKPSFFVAMPFTKEYEDTFIIGIREVAEKLGVVALRLDEIEHNSSIPALIANKIKAADALIAETTEPNKNVFYEVGLAHGLGKEVIFLCKAGTEAALRRGPYQSHSLRLPR